MQRKNHILIHKRSLRKTRVTLTRTMMVTVDLQPLWVTDVPLKMMIDATRLLLLPALVE